jgi:hypothetical protein
MILKISTTHQPAFRTLPGVSVDDTARLISISAHAPKGEDIQLPIPSMVFAVKPFKVGTHVSITSKEIDSMLASVPTFTRIQQRVNLLDNTDGMSSSSSEQTDSNEPITMGVHVGFCVQAVKFRDAQNKVKYYALSPNKTSFTSAVSVGGNVMAPKLEKLDRGDFVNPKDVDWMFGVEDFTKTVL